MASSTHSALARPVPRFAGRNGLVDRYFYFAMSLLFALLVAWGFSHTVDENLLHPTVSRPSILWYHAAAFSLWVVFYIFQSALVRTRNVKWHRFFGWFGAGLGAVMLPLGITTAVVMGRFETNQLHEARSAVFRIVPFYDMVAFAVLFGLAVFWRRKPELHRRLMFIATCTLLSAAFGRMPYFGPHLLFFVGVDATILLGVARDLLVSRRIHRVYLIALPVLILCQAFVLYTWLSGAAWWVAAAHAIVS